MESFDISHLPQPVHDAVLHLMETLVQAFPQPAEKPTDQRPIAGPHPLLEGEGSMRPPPAQVETLPIPTPVRCPHGTRETPCCAACTTLYRAEAMLVDAQVDEPQRWPRSPVELQILAALQQMAPLPVTPRQVAAMLGMPPEQVRLLLQALATLGTVDHPTSGYYRHKAAGVVCNTPCPAPQEHSIPSAILGATVSPRADVPLDAMPHAARSWSREESAQHILEALRTAFPYSVSSHELKGRLGILHSSPLLRTLCARGQVERAGHGRYRYRVME